MRMLLHWIVTALAVWITSRVVSGFYVDGPAAALIAAVVIGLVNATLGLFLKVITFPRRLCPASTLEILERRSWAGLCSQW
jgi:putative membrane protein